MFGRVAAWAVRRAHAVLFGAVVLAIAAGIAAASLPSDAGTDTLVDEDSATARATDHYHRLFGDDAVVVLVKGDLRNLLLTANLGRLLRLEGCLSARVPKQAKPLPGPCTELAELAPVRVVYGPATVLNQAVLGIQSALGGQIQQAQLEAQRAARQAAREAAAQGLSASEQRQAANAAATAVSRRFQQRLLTYAAQYGISSVPTLGNAQFVEEVVFDIRRPGFHPKARFGYVFPNRDAAIIQVRLKPDIGDSERERAIELIRAAVSDTTPRKVCDDQPCFKLNGGSYVVSGVPVVVDGLAGILKDALLVLFAAALVIMALALLLVFRSRMRLLPLALGLASASLTFGLVGLLGGALTMASIAVLPILIGLAVDYAIQLQARFDEALEADLPPAEAARLAAVRGGPVVGAACLASAAAFLALQLSPVPMVRGFGLMLVVGIAIAFVVSVTVGSAALSLRRAAASGRSAGAGRRARTRERAGNLSDRAWARVRGAGKRALAVSIAQPGRVLAVALALGVCGWVADTGTEVESEFTKLVPGDLREVRDLKELQSATGVGGELDVVVRAPDMTDPDVISWMALFKQRVLEENGFGGEFPSCAKAELCPGPALSDFFTNPTLNLTRQRVTGLIRLLPNYLSQAVLTRDPRTGEGGHTANLAFGIRSMPLDEQKRLIDDIRSQIDPPGPGNGPPAGVEVEVAGLPALAAEANAALSGSRYWLTLAGLAAVALALLGIYRSAARALVPLIPIVLATGWSSLVLAASDIPLNPLSATLGALVIAIATEFSVLLAARYHEERGRGRSVGEALRHAYARTGAAVLASGVSAIAGFAALMASDIQMLRDFGLVTVVDLGVALAGVMLVLPAALVWAEQGFLVGGAPLPRALPFRRPTLGAPPAADAGASEQHSQ
jgi:uncharacterized protein